MKNLSAIDWVTLVLVIIGALNWGLVGIFRVDLVALIFGEMGTLARVVYTLVGVSGLYLIYGSMQFGRK